MKLRFLLAPLLASGLLAASLAAGAGFLDQREVREFIDEMVAEHNYDAAELERLLGQAEHQQGIIDAISRPAERVLSWGEYRDIFLDQARIEQGVEFWQAHADQLARAESEFGVPPEVIVAVLGVETRYGRHKGRWRVLDALTTLGFDYPPRASFFRRELREFLLLVREEGQDATSIKGSYAGAMGYGQFISSSYRAYAVDFDGDQVRDIWNNPVDAIGSIGNYFAVHRWQPGEEVTRPVPVPEQDVEDLLDQGLRPYTRIDELRARGVAGLDGLQADAPATLMRLEAHDGPRYFVGLRNFYAITRYNHSALYAMAVHDLSQAVLKAYKAAAE